ncbi:mannose-1-phosphate guanylyltransferase [Nitratireductor aestuarii]|uniref:Mannose-1-phosphate guanylyltransferase n=1 Tax=Nitratireductor aestuarii TaxID=1735103 RepID=A0A916W0X4_9HYPH|nr:nucleotidyltransferase family protein [Nitratireductor aestuarii]GGA57426.1 mannose-1-phosphate guanylyltransferase [Nitratireductor aestuarii]
MNGSPDKAMVLAAGLGTRMRPLTDHMPKPLVRVGGKTLLDWGLDALGDAGVREAVVNVHYFPDMLVEHVASRQTPAITISDERDQLLDSAGGIVKALSFFGGEPFFILNADTFWIDRDGSNLERLASFWDGERMDILLMLADPQIATGHTGKLDFVMKDGGALQRARGADNGFIYAGVAILHPRIFEGASPEPHSLNLYFDRAIAADRLFGLPLDGHWLTVGTPDAIAPAEDVLRQVSKAS